MPDFKKLKPVPFTPSLSFPLDTLEFSPEMPEAKAIDFAHCAGLLQQYLGQLPEAKKEEAYASKRGAFIPFCGTFYSVGRL